MINFMIENWYHIVAAIAILVVAGVFVYEFVKKPRSVQIEKIEEWLLYAVTKAEETYGSGTGQIKLRMVYDMFVSRFPEAGKIVSFEAFSMMVDKALEKMKKMLEDNKVLAEKVEGKDD